MRTAIPLRARATALAAPRTGRHARPRKYPARRPSGIPAVPGQFLIPAENKWSRHERNHAPPILLPPGHNPGAATKTPCIPLTIITPAVLSLAGIRTTGDAPSTCPGPAGPGQDHSGRWLRNAAAGLCALAAAAATVSFAAQYQMINATRHLTAIAALEAAIPDTAALVFACLGIALALRGRRALRARALNLASVGTSVFMNTIAAAPGWRNLAIWAMPPIAYALASDTLIGVVRVIARHQHRHDMLTGETATPLAIVGGLALWLLRLALAPASTASGFRAWVLTECPVAPGRRAPRPEQPPTPARPRRGRGTEPRKATKTARFLDLTAERHGPLAHIPLDRVAGISADLAPQVGLNPGAARTALRRAILSARNGDPR